jgi:hypothetical protein
MPPCELFRLLVASQQIESLDSCSKGWLHDRHPGTSLVVWLDKSHLASERPSFWCLISLARQQSFAQASVHHQNPAVCKGNLVVLALQQQNAQILVITSLFFVVNRELTRVDFDSP